jgi:hypothetical protein
MIEPAWLFLDARAAVVWKAMEFFCLFVCLLTEYLVDVQQEDSVALTAVLYLVGAGVLVVLLSKAILLIAGRLIVPPAIKVHNLVCVFYFSIDQPFRS